MFENSNVLFLLFIIPLLCIFFLFCYKKKQRDIFKFANKDVLYIISNINLKKYLIKSLFIVISFFFLIIALARPQYGAKTSFISKKSATIVIVIDASKSMLAQDLKPNRLEKAKSALSNLIIGFKGNKVGIVSFAGTAFWHCPITADTSSANNFLSSISIEDMPLGGTKIAKALDLAISGTADIPEGAKAIILVTDGEDDDSGLSVLIEKAKKYKTKIYTIGIGKKEGVKILYNGNYIKDEYGNYVVSKLDEDTLNHIAKETGGQYINLSESEDSVFKILQIANSLDKTKDDVSKEIHREERYQIFLLFSLLLFCVYLFLDVLKNKKGYKK